MYIIHVVMYHCTIYSLCLGEPAPIRHCEWVLPRLITTRLLQSCLLYLRTRLMPAGARSYSDNVKPTMSPIILQCRVLVPCFPLLVTFTICRIETVYKHPFNLYTQGDTLHHRCIALSYLLLSWPAQRDPSRRLTPLSQVLM